MSRHYKLSFAAVVLLPLFSLHCGSAPNPGVELGNGGGAGGAGGDEGMGGESIGGEFGFDFGFGGDDLGEAGQGGGGASGDPGIQGCSDGIVQSGEACDDGNGLSGDGCSATCAELEQDFACPVPGQGCVSTVECGDGRINGAELCDDGNTSDGDGCSALCDGVTEGWSCVLPGLRCEATACGDGLVAGVEECDFATATTGCTSCKIDDAYDCNGAGCALTDCGNTVVERGEQCDDGNDRPFDGCFDCRSEPECTDGVCTSVCGDGQRFADEDCDDGNSRDFDGCSAACTIEQGFACVPQPGAPPTTIGLPVVFRDFIGQDNSLRTGCYNPVNETPTPGEPIPCFHIDFNQLGGSGIPGVVEFELGSNGRPVYVCPDPLTSCSQNPGDLEPNPAVRRNFNGATPFAEWYDSSSDNNIEVLGTLTLTRNPTLGTYVFDAGEAFYPIDAAGWVLAGEERLADAAPCNHNASFTSETHFWFEYEGGEQFEFIGDDDLWVFVNGKLVLDLGGLHVSQTASFVLDADTDAAGVDTADGTADVDGHHADIANLDLDMNVGGVYEIVLFHAERNECGSNFKVTLKDFNRPKSVCESTCGDGVVASDELCDDGPGGNDGAYGHCGANCLSRGPYCGDGIPASSEECDDGENMTGYGVGCAPGCNLPATCGDGQIDAVFGEACDDGVNDGSYGGCTASCQHADRCGDGNRQSSVEQCDDSNLLSGDGCSGTCRIEQPR